MNSIEAMDLINELKLSRREEQVLRGLAVREPIPGSERRYAIPFAKGVAVAVIIILAGLSFGYLLFLARSKWLDYIELLVQLGVYIWAIVSMFMLSVRDSLIRKLYRALGSRGTTLESASPREMNR